MIQLRIISFLGIFLVLSYNTYSQETIQVDPEITQQFASPLIEGISGSMNSGWFQRAPKSQFLGFEMELTFIGMGTFLDSDQKSFNSNSRVKFPESTIDKMVEGMDSRIKGLVKDSLMNSTFQVNISGPTAIGSSAESVQINYPGDTISVNYMGEERKVIVPGVNVDSKVKGINMPVAPMGTLQLSLGTLAGTKLSLRFTPPVFLGKEIGSITNYGIGIHHNLMVWFTKKPAIDISMAFYMQKLSIGEVFKSTSIQYGLFVSKTLGGSSINVTPFSGLTLEKNNSNIRYNYNYTDNYGNSGELQIAMDLNSGSLFRFRTGASLKLSVVNLTLTYGYSSHHSLSAGFGLIF